MTLQRVLLKSSPTTTTVLLLLFCLVVLLVPTCQAEKRIHVNLEETIVPIGQLSSRAVLFGTLHGSGSLDVSRLQYLYKFDSRNHHPNTTSNKVIALSVLLSTQRDFERLKKWQLEEDTADSRAKRDEYLLSKGIGAMGNDGTYYVCCSRAALEAKACDPNWSLTRRQVYDREDEEEGYFNLTLTNNLIVKHLADNKPGSHFMAAPLNIKKSGEEDINAGDFGDQGVFWFGQSRNIALYFAYCGDGRGETTTNTHNEKLYINGIATLTSALSASTTLPLYVLLCLCHGGLSFWWYYSLSLRSRCQNNNANNNNGSCKALMIPPGVERWILIALTLATIASLTKTIYYFAETFTTKEWNRFHLIAGCCISVAHIVNRCLFLLLARGTGIVTKVPKATLDSRVFKNKPPRRATILIGSLLILWILCALATNVGATYRYYYYRTTFGKLCFVAACIEFICLPLLFMIWIPISLRQTMRRLQKYQHEQGNAGEEEEESGAAAAVGQPSIAAMILLKQYQGMWKIYWLSLFLGAIQCLLLILDGLLDAGRDDDPMVFDEQRDITYLILLVCVAVLWKPPTTTNGNPSGSSEMSYSYYYQLLEEEDGELLPERTTTTTDENEMILELSPTTRKFREAIVQVGDEDHPHDLQLSTTTTTGTAASLEEPLLL